MLLGGEDRRKSTEVASRSGPTCRAFQAPGIEVAITIEWRLESAENASESAPTLCQQGTDVRGAVKADEASILFVRVRRTKCRDHMAILEDDSNRKDGALNAQQRQGQSSERPIPISGRKPSRYVPEDGPHTCLQCEPDGKRCESRVPMADRSRCPQLNQGQSEAYETAVRNPDTTGLPVTRRLIEPH